jgi:hypothetical protein
MVAHAQISLPQAAHALAQSHSPSRFWAPRHLSSHAVHNEKKRLVDATLLGGGDPSFGIPFRERLEVIHHRRRLADAVR